MSELAKFACALGGLEIAGCLVLLFAPDQGRRVLTGFSRHEVSGWLLTAIDVFWAGWLILHTPPFSVMKNIEPLVYLGAPLAFFLLVIFMDEMLAPRALGGFFLLIATPILESARWHESEWSLVMKLIAYAWVIVGMFLVVTPYRYRWFVSHFTRDCRRFRNGSLVGLVAGVFLVTLGLTVY